MHLLLKLILVALGALALILKLVVQGHQAQGGGGGGSGSGWTWGWRATHTHAHSHPDPNSHPNRRAARLQSHHVGREAQRRAQFRAKGRKGKCSHHVKVWRCTLMMTSSQGPKDLSDRTRTPWFAPSTTRLPALPALSVQSPDPAMVFGLSKARALHITIATLHLVVRVPPGGLCCCVVLCCVQVP